VVTAWVARSTCKAITPVLRAVRMTNNITFGNLNYSENIVRLKESA
jgi:hypothetical protein